MHGGLVNLLGTFGHWMVDRSTDGTRKGVNSAISIRASGWVLCYGLGVYEYDGLNAADAWGRA